MEEVIEAREKQLEMEEEREKELEKGKSEKEKEKDKRAKARAGRVQEWCLKRASELHAEAEAERRGVEQAAMTAEDELGAGWGTATRRGMESCSDLIWLLDHDHWVEGEDPWSRREQGEHAANVALGVTQVTPGYTH